MAQLSPDELAAQDPDELADNLVRLANDVRDDLREGKRARPISLLEHLHQASRKASGPQLALLEVAISLLKAATRTDFGRPELALHEILAEGNDQVDAFLAKACERVAFTSEIAKLPEPIAAQVRRLCDLGVLRQIDDLVDVAPKYRAMLSELLEPLPFRLWREVTEVRNEIMAQRLPEHQAAALIAGQFGLGQQQASLYLRRHPPVEWLTTRPMTQRYQRPPIRGNGPTSSSADASPLGSVWSQQPGEAEDRAATLLQGVLSQLDSTPILQ